MSGDDAGEWLSYSELAARRGISRESANRLVIRRRWRKQKGNGGRVRVFVPLDHLTPDTSPDASPDMTPDTSGDAMLRRIAALEAAIAALEVAQNAALEAVQHERGRAELERVAAADREAWLRARIEALTVHPFTWRDLVRWIHRRS